MKKVMRKISLGLKPALQVTSFVTLLCKVLERNFGMLKIRGLETVSWKPRNLVRGETVSRIFIILERTLIIKINNKT